VKALARPAPREGFSAAAQPVDHAWPTAIQAAGAVQATPDSKNDDGGVGVICQLWPSHLSASPRTFAWFVLASPTAMQSLVLTHETASRTVLFELAGLGLATICQVDVPGPLSLARTAGGAPASNATPISAATARSRQIEAIFHPPGVARFQHVGARW
jgi:hypothetical protein